MTATAIQPAISPVLSGALPKVSVAMITYNHEKFIAQAVESVLMQETPFAYEIVIGEDCSIDRTRDIVIDFQRRYPGKIRLLLADQNLGAQSNFAQTLQACQGQYVALLEGDDYWTSSQKLRKQVAFLDSHPECAICFHNATTFYDDGKHKPHSYCLAGQKEFSTLDDLLLRNFIPTCAVMFRNRLFQGFPDWFCTLQIGDWPLHVLNAQHGQIGYINEVMAAYRKHPGGVWAGQTLPWRWQQNIAFYEAVGAHLGVRYRRIVKSRISLCLFQLSVAYHKEGELAKARKCALRSLVECPTNPYVSRMARISLLLNVSAPTTYRAVATLNRLIRNPLKVLL
jgi:glycosyltransferase involved in cell wall biosynthesis